MSEVEGRTTRPSSWRFGPFVVDPATGELTRQGRRVKLQGQAFEVLVALLEQPGQLVTRESLQQRLWPSGTFVGFEEGLNTAVARLRRSLADDADRPRLIETLPKRGYRFIGELEPADLPAPPSVSASVPSPPAVGDVVARSAPRWWPRAAVVGVGAAALVATVLVVVHWGSGGAVPARSIAVLPFANLSGDANEEYLADAITDGLTTDLARIDALAVRSHGSVLQFKGSRATIPEIARTLRADVVVEGSLARSGDRVRVTAQLIDAKTDRHLWADTFERDLHDVLTLEDDIARAIASGIRVTLTPTERGRLNAERVQNLDAYLPYLRGRSLWNQRTAPALQQGIESFRQSLDADPSYAEAWAGIADCWTALGYGSYVAPGIAFAAAKDAAAKAIALNPDLADAHASIAYAALYYDWDFDKADREFHRAIALNPGSATAEEWYAVYLTAMGRFDEARAAIGKAETLDPFSPAVQTDAGFVAYYSGQYDAAVKELRATIEMNPKFPLAHLWLGRTYQQTGRFDDALAEYSATEAVLGEWPVAIAAKGNAYAFAGREREARGELDALIRLSKEKYVTPYATGLIYAALGDRDRAFAALRQAVTDRSNWLVWLELDKRWGAVRQDRRFEGVLRAVHPSGPR